MRRVRTNEERSKKRSPEVNGVGARPGVVCEVRGHYRSNWSTELTWCYNRNNGPGGTGKSFTWNTLAASCRGRSLIVLCVASSGIASLILTGGWISHSMLGGITVAFGGDFQQTLPIIPKGTKEQIIGACIQRSRLWRHIKVLHLIENMQVDPNDEQSAQFEQ